MDGTLTVSVHDFDAIRRELGLPDGLEILEALAALPEERARPLRRRLMEIDMQLAARARPSAGAASFLGWLRARGARLGVLTRNARPAALETLRVAGLDGFFETRALLGRDEAEPKPSPSGVRALLRAWGAAAGDAVVAGDYLFDLKAGRAAGTATVYVDEEGRFPHREHADLCVRRLDEIPSLEG